MRQAADDAGGKALLRIEDIDLARCRPEYEKAIYEDLAWLGLEWDGEVRCQSEHFEAYALVIDTLRARGLIYRCFRTRAKISELMGETESDAFISGPLPAAEERARLADGEAFAWRLSLARARDEIGPAFDNLTFSVETETGTQPITAQPWRFGDIALTRKDSPVAYHLAACHDDAVQGITHVIRGKDLEQAPHIQIVLHRLMDWPTPVYRHHRLLSGPDGKRFAKRDKSRTICAMRETGLTPEDVLKLAGIE